MNRLFASLLVLTPFTAAAAQRLPVPEAGDRQLQLVDLRALRPGDGPDPVLRLQAELPPIGPNLVEFLRAFAEPALRPGDAIERLGDDHLVVLGPPALCDRVSQLITEARRRRDRQEQLAIEIRLIRLDDDAFPALLAPFFAAGDPPAGADRSRPQRVAADADLEVLLAALRADPRAEIVEAPRLLTEQLGDCSLSTGDELSYVRDFAVRRRAGAAVADPIVDRIFHGTRAGVLAASLDDDHIAVACAVEHTVVQEPLAETELDIGLANTVKVQLPRASTITVRQRVVLPQGHGVVVAGRREDGSWLATLLRVQRVQQTKPAKTR